jgi:hypothetical protein
MSATIAEAARIYGGKLTTRHGPNCHTHRGGECGCSPSYRLQRIRRDRRAR